MGQVVDLIEFLTKKRDEYHTKAMDKMALAKKRFNQTHDHILYNDHMLEAFDELKKCHYYKQQINFLLPKTMLYTSIESAPQFYQDGKN